MNVVENGFKDSFYGHKLSIQEKEHMVDVDRRINNDDKFVG